MAMRRTALKITLGAGFLLAVSLALLSLSNLTLGAGKDAKAPVPKESGVDPGENFSIFDLVTECDMLAAHPEDPQRMADGVPDDEIVPRLAIMACEDAVTSDPEEPRYAFQLGRALLALGRKEKAREQFERAAKAGYAAAEAYIGDLYQFGFAVTQDSKKALEHYRKAVAGEFKIAESQIDQLTFDSGLYVSRAIGDLYTGDFQRVTGQSDKLLRNYLHNFVLATMKECEAFLTPKSLVNFYLYRYPTDYNPDDDTIGVAIQTSVGEFDAEVFVRRHGCEGPVAKQLFGNIIKFFSAM